MNDDLRREGHARHGEGLHSPVRVTQQLICTRNHLMKTAVEIFRGVRMPPVPFTSYAPGQWFYPRSRKRNHFQTLATGVPKLKTLLGTQWVNIPPPPPTTLIPHIEVGFKWMWTQSVTPNKMAPVFVDLCAGLVVLLPRQIRRFCHGFFSSAVLDWSLRSCLRARHLWRQQIADNRRYLRRSFLPWTSSLRSQISLSKRRLGYYGKPLDEAVSNFFFEPSLSEKFGLWKIPIGNHIHLNLTWKLCAVLV